VLVVESCGGEGEAAVKDVARQVATMAAPYGTVTVSEPRKARHGWGRDVTMQSTVKVTSHDRVMDFSVTYRQDKMAVDVAVRYSRPSLGYGVGATYSLHDNGFDQFGRDSLVRALESVLSRAEEEQPTS
jgi:hypothetical protein